jgi:acyl-homoserine-lactone acylase
MPPIRFRSTIAAGLLSVTIAAGPADEELWRDVEVIRTEHGVPHIRARTLRAGAYALAWIQSEDHGPRTAMNVLRASGNMARVFGYDSIESDFGASRDRRRVAETYHLLEEPTRDVYEGFAEGLNRFVALHPDRFPPGMPGFSGYDVAALDIGGPSPGALRGYRRRLDPAARADRPGDDADAQAACTKVSTRA